MKNKFILGILFSLLSTACYAQKNTPFIPFEIAPEKHSFVLPVLQVDSIFIKNLDAALFDENDRWWKSDKLIGANKANGHFYIHFEKTDSLVYNIEVSFWNMPAEKSSGFFEHNNYFYWISGEIPPNIVLGTKSKKHFSYMEDPAIIEDPLMWLLIYDARIGNIKVKKKNFCYK